MQWGCWTWEVLFLQEAKSNWQAIKKGLKLVPEDNDDMK